MTYRIIILTICLMSLSMGIVLGDTGGLAILAVNANNTQLDVGFREINGTWTIEGEGSRIENKTLKEVEAIFHSFGCDGIKTIQVGDSNPSLALDVVFNGSIASAIEALNAYGMKNLPSETAKVSPYGYWMRFPGREYFWDSNEKIYIDIWTYASLTGEKKPSEIKKEEEEAELSFWRKRNASDLTYTTENQAIGFLPQESQENPNQLISVGASGMGAGFLGGV